MTEFSNGLLFCDVSTVQSIRLAWRHENWGGGGCDQRFLYDTHGVAVVVHYYLFFKNDFRNQNSVLLSTTFVPEFSVQINTGKFKNKVTLFAYQ